MATTLATDKVESSRWGYISQLGTKEVHTSVLPAHAHGTCIHMLREIPLLRCGSLSFHTLMLVCILELFPLLEKSIISLEHLSFSYSSPSLPLEFLNKTRFYFTTQFLLKFFPERKATDQNDLDLGCISLFCKVYVLDPV